MFETIIIETGSIVYLGLFLSKFTGENFLYKSKPKNEFDTLFIFIARQTILVYSIAIPFTIVLIYILTLLILNTRKRDKDDIITKTIEMQLITKKPSFQSITT